MAKKTDETAEHFAHELDNLVHRFTLEYNIAFATVIGALHMKAHDLCVEAYELGPEDDEDEPKGIDHPLGP